MPQSQVIAVKGVEPKLVQIIMDEIVEGGAKVQWTDIAGQEVSLFNSMMKNSKYFIFVWFT